MPIFLRRSIAGFVHGALAVAIFHQGMYWTLLRAGMGLQGAPWSMAAAGGTPGVPVLLNQMFWGGLWGIAFAWLYGLLPGRWGWLRGLVFGCVFPMLVGSWLVVALMKGRPILAGVLIDGNFQRLLSGFLLNGVAFGVGVGLLWPMLARLAGLTPAASCSPPRSPAS